VTDKLPNIEVGFVTDVTAYATTGVIAKLPKTIVGFVTDVMTLAVVGVTVALVPETIETVGSVTDVTA